ncbi:hypothetical protein B0H21DRAFT_708387 [Amylocystis lapponica]|nr:hypothetical protein B0H21DRAFT_708387 [Amylocystis lapponica]
MPVDVPHKDRILALRPRTDIESIRQMLASRPHWLVEQVEIHGCTVPSHGESRKDAGTGSAPDGVPDHLWIDDTVPALELRQRVDRLVLKDIVWGLVGMASRNFLLQNFRTITVLDLQHVDCFGPNQLLRILDSFPALEELSLWTVDWTMPSAPQHHQLTSQSPLHLRRLVLADTEASQLVGYWLLGRRPQSAVENVRLMYNTHREALLDMIWFSRFIARSASSLEQVEYRIVAAPADGGEVPRRRVGRPRAQGNLEDGPDRLAVGPLEHYGLDETTLTLADDEPPCIRDLEQIDEGLYTRSMQPLPSQGPYDRYKEHLDRVRSNMNHFPNSAVQTMSISIPWYPQCLVPLTILCTLLTPRTSKFELTVRFADIREFNAMPWPQLDSLLADISVQEADDRSFELYIFLGHIMDCESFDLSVRSALPRVCARGHLAIETDVYIDGRRH